MQNVIFVENPHENEQNFIPYILCKVTEKIHNLGSIASKEVGYVKPCWKLYVVMYSKDTSRFHSH